MRISYVTFSVRLWWRESIEKLRWRIAWLIPRKIALLCFVRVSASTREAPGPEYSNAYRAFEQGAGR